MSRCALVVIGTSWGGLNAMKMFLQALRADFATPIVLVQHRAPDSDESIVHLLQRQTALKVLEAQDKEPFVARHLYVAPPDYHTLVEPSGIALSLEDMVNHSRPSIDVLFDSAAHAFKDRVAAVLMTGASEDGARGLLAIKDAGGRPYVQDPMTAESPIMPNAGLKALGVANGKSLENIARELGDYCE